MSSFDQFLACLMFIRTSPHKNVEDVLSGSREISQEELKNQREALEKERIAIETQRKKLEEDQRRQRDQELKRASISIEVQRKQMEEERINSILFQKKMACLSLKSGLEQDLREKSNDGWKMSLEEIFYSPTEDDCFYIDNVRQYLGHMKRVLRVGMNPSGDPFEDLSAFYFSPYEQAKFEKTVEADYVLDMRERERKRLEKRVRELKAIAPK